MYLESETVASPSGRQSQKPVRV